MDQAQSLEPLLGPERQHAATDEARLAELGYKQELLRAFAPYEVFG